MFIRDLTSILVTPNGFGAGSEGNATWNGRLLFDEGMTFRSTLPACGCSRGRG